jgi:hypothetical protein
MSAGTPEARVTAVGAYGNLPHATTIAPPVPTTSHSGRFIAQLTPGLMIVVMMCAPDQPHQHGRADRGQM